MNIFTLIQDNPYTNISYSVEEYEIYTEEMNQIYNLLTSYIDKSSIEINLIDIDNQTDKKKNQQNLRITINKNELSESDDESVKSCNSVSSKDGIEIDNNLEEYYDSDSSASVYKKASANTSKRANKIINLTI